MKDNNKYVWGIWLSLIIGNLLYLISSNNIFLAVALIFSILFLVKAIQFNKNNSKN